MCRQVGFEWDNGTVWEKVEKKPGNFILRSGEKRL
jgi:hypothetical protein